MGRQCDSAFYSPASYPRRSPNTPSVTDDRALPRRLPELDGIALRIVNAREATGLGRVPVDARLGRDADEAWARSLKCPGLRKAHVDWRGKTMARGPSHRQTRTFGVEQIAEAFGETVEPFHADASVANRSTAPRRWRSCHSTRWPCFRNEPVSGRQDGASLSQHAQLCGRPRLGPRPGTSRPTRLLATARCRQ
jgi:hypothetical protein